jgi:site-specific DNA-methyltransferase (adenine-specific)
VNDDKEEEVELFSEEETISSKIIISNDDCIDFIKNLPEKVNVWITDPPYPFDNKNGKNRFKFVNGVDGMYDRMSYSDLAKVYKQMYDSSEDGAMAYVFCSKDSIFSTKESLDKAGWTYRNMLCWDKVHFGMGYHWRNQMEFILYVTKGKPKRYVTNKGNLLSYKKPKGLSAKPPEIWAEILESSICDGDIVADPFAGSDPLTKALEELKLLNKIKKSYSNIK